MTASSTGGTRRVVLRNVRDAGGTRYLSATLGAHGLRIFGFDRGPGVARYWGSDAYEWQYSIAAEHLPGLVAVLVGGPSDDVLAALQRHYREQPGRGIEDVIGPGLVPASFSSRLGE